MSAVHVNILEIPGQNYFIFRICDFGRRAGGTSGGVRDRGCFLNSARLLSSGGVLVVWNGKCGLWVWNFLYEVCFFI